MERGGRGAWRPNLHNLFHKHTSATKIIFGAIEDKTLAPDEVKITLIAAGLENK